MIPKWKKISTLDIKIDFHDKVYANKKKKDKEFL